jgi:hypothetical protein
MNENKQSLPWWQFLLIFVVFWVALGMSFIYRQQIAENVLVPILYLLWMTELALRILGQQCIWTLAILTTLILSIIFFRQKEKPTDGSDRTVYHRRLAVGRIQFWRRRVRVKSNAFNGVSYRRSEMRQLILQALAYRYSRDTPEIEIKLRSGQLSVPAEVSAILGLDDQPIELRKSINLIELVKLRIDWITERFTHSKFIPDPQIEKVADYLENLMEVDNDDRNH